MAQTPSNLLQTSVQTDLPSPADFAQALSLRLPDFYSVQWLAQTGSTNMDLMQRLRQTAHPARTDLPCLLGAHLQTAGRGRAGRVWHNLRGDALMFSCAFQINIPIAQLAGVSPALGIAACEALRSLIDPARHPTGSSSQTETRRLTLKWPNDLQWDAGKLAGILVETLQPAGSDHPFLVAGIGLNLRRAVELSEALGRPISDWSQICDLPAAQIVTAIARGWAQALKDYAATGFEGFRSRFAQVDVLPGAQVTVTDQGKTLHTGMASGTDALGRLLVQTASGIVPIMVGDISIRTA